MIGYCKQCKLYTFLAENKKCNNCNSPYMQYNRNYEETNILYNDDCINVTARDLANTLEIKE